MEFRNALPEDLGFIVTVYNSTVESRMVTADTMPVTVADKLNWFGKHSTSARPLWIIEAEGKPIGWVSFQDFYGRPAYSGSSEVSIYLDTLQRGKGIGKQVLAYCIAAAPNLGIHTLLGYIFAHNKPSIKLFTSLGFKEWAHLPDVAVMDNIHYSLKIYGLKTT